jgi:hypothetical protein
MRSEASQPDLLSLIAAAGIGATVMYLLDPDRGNRRRHLIADKFIHAGNQASEAVGKTRRDLGNHARGVAATVQSRFGSGDADDRVVTERVRAQLGRAVSHPGAIQVTAELGVVTLSGDVLEGEADELLAQARGVRGVTSVEDQLRRHTSPGNIPALQGESRGPANRFELFQENWTPAARFLVGLAGSALASSALKRGLRGQPLSSLLALAGLALFARSATNKDFRNLRDLLPLRPDRDGGAGLRREIAGNLREPGVDLDRLDASRLDV